MTRATKLYRNRIALIFDFDDTLAPSTFHFMLSKLGMAPQDFEKMHVQPMVDSGWEKILARYHCLIRESNNNGHRVTEEFMTQLGREFPLFDHTSEMFDKVRRWAEEIIDDIEVEFYMLTAGLAEIPEATAIASEFKQIWGGAGAFNEEGELVFVKRIITHPEKRRYLTQLAKGLHLDGSLQPENIYRDVPSEDYYIPFDQMIYVGDGGSDMSAFCMMEDVGGIAIGVVLAEELENWRGYDEIHEDRRVENLAAADYSAGSELMQSLEAAVKSIAYRVALRKRSHGE